MKIGILNIYSELANRGAETVAHELGNYLAKKHEVVLFQAGMNKIKVKYEVKQVQGFELKITAPGSSLVSKIQHWLYQDEHNKQVARFTKECLGEAERKGIEIMIGFNGVRQAQILKREQRRLGYKIILPNHSQYHPQVWRLAGFDNYLKLRSEPDVFVSLNPLMHEWALKYKSGKTLCVMIPNGVNLEKFNPKVKPEKVGLEGRVVVCVAGLQKYKRVELLIRAVSLIPEASLLVLGEGEEKASLERLGEEMLGSHRFKILKSKYDQMPGYYAAGGVFSLPSLPLEAFGVAYLEAMAINLPIVAPNDSSRKYIVGDAGVYVDVEKAEHYAKGIREAFSMSWGNKPRLQAEKFSWDKVGLLYEKLIEKWQSD